MKNKKFNGIYLAVDYHPNTNIIINKICKDFGVDADNGPDGEYKFHTTIAYMKFSKYKLTSEEKERLMSFETKNGSTIEKKKRPKLQIPITVIGFGFFDTPTGRNFHIKVKSPFLLAEFRRAKNYGIKYSYAKYAPHITISNDVPKDFKLDQKLVSKYKGTVLYTNDQYVQNIEN